jgi:hypothetical protein
MLLDFKTVKFKSRFAFWMAMTRRPFFIIFCAMTCLPLLTIPAAAGEYWKKESASWKISCGVDKGSIVRKSGTTYVFKTSSNKCVSRGTYDQRAEISGLYLSASKKASYKFTATIQMETDSSEQFTVFQVHDGRGSCAPPLKIHWTRSNTLLFYSSHSLDKGAHDCVENEALVKQRYTGPRLRRDGTPYELTVVLDFDGSGGFAATVFVDNINSLSGFYTPPDDKRFFRSNRFWLKHGHYSKNAWPYTLTSSNITTYRKISGRATPATTSSSSPSETVDR